MFRFLYEVYRTPHFLISTSRPPPLFASARLPVLILKKRKQTTTTTGWVSKLGGVVELAQALCSPSFSSSSADRSGDRSSRRRKGHSSSASGARAGADTESSGSVAWRSSATLELAKPLFDSLPALLASAQSCSPSSSSSHRGVGGVGEAGISEGDLAAVEYALWLTMDVLGAVLRRREQSVGLLASSSNGGEGEGLFYDGSRAGEDAERVLTCVRENPSPQTRRVIFCTLLFTYSTRCLS